MELAEGKRKLLMRERCGLSPTRHLKTRTAGEGVATVMRHPARRRCSFHTARVWHCHPCWPVQDTLAAAHAALIRPAPRQGHFRQTAPLSLCQERVTRLVAAWLPLKHTQECHPVARSRRERQRARRARVPAGALPAPPAALPHHPSRSHAAPHPPLEAFP